MFAKHIKPDFSKSQAANITKRLYGFTPIKIGSLPSYMDQNFYVATAEGGKYVLKIFNVKDSEKATVIEVQTSSMTFLRQNGFPVPTPIPATSGQITSLEEAGTELNQSSHITYMLKMIQYIILYSCCQI